MVIHIDPGTAFGTGMHETTQLCIRALKKYVTSETEILDVGCGSGILGCWRLSSGQSILLEQILIHAPLMRLTRIWK